MISPSRAVLSLSRATGSAAGDSSSADFSSWHNIGDVAQLGLAVWDVANRAKDRQDEAIDAMRVSNGMTLDQFLSQK